MGIEKKGPKKHTNRLQDNGVKLPRQVDQGAQRLKPQSGHARGRGKRDEQEEDRSLRGKPTGGTQRTWYPPKGNEVKPKGPSATKRESSLSKKAMKRGKMNFFKNGKPKIHTPAYAALIGGVTSKIIRSFSFQRKKYKKAGRKNRTGGRRCSRPQGRTL